MARPYRRKGSRFWYIAPVVNGVQAPQSSGTTDYAAALQKLRELEGDIAAGKIQSFTTDRGLFADLLEDVKTDYKLKERRSVTDLERRIDNHIKPGLGHLKSRQVSSAIINRYILERKTSADQPANATLNRELAVIKRAFNLGRIAGKVSRLPHIEMLPEDNEREEFYSPEQFRAVIRRCNAIAAAILEMAYITGWRIRSVIRLEWRQVDFDGGFVWLNSRDTKNRKPVRWPLRAGLRELLQARKDATEIVERRKSCIIPFVFHRNGRPVKSIRTAWERARVAAGVPGHHIHDFRGTAIVNLLEAGVDIPKIMSMVGLSFAMVARYAKRRGSREESLIEAAEKLEKRLNTPSRAKSTTVGRAE
jgi:integrase